MLLALSVALTLSAPLVGQLAAESQQPRDDITDSYQEMLMDPAKKLVSLGVTNPDKLDLAHNVVLQNQINTNRFDQLYKNSAHVVDTTGSLNEKQDDHTGQLASSYQDMLSHPR